jgi:hypothetical protein
MVTVGNAFNGTTPIQADTSDLGEDKEAVVEAGAILELRVGEAVIAIATMEAWIARLIASTDALEKRLEGAINPQYDILQHLGVDLRILRHCLLNTWQFGLLLVIRDGDATRAPGCSTLANGGVVHMAAEHQRALKHKFLIRCWLEVVFVGFADALLLFHTPLFCPIGTHVTIPVLSWLWQATKLPVFDFFKVLKTWI